MAYMVFEGASYKEAFDQMYSIGAEKNILPQMNIVKRVEEEKKTFFGLKKNKTYKIIVFVTENIRARTSERSRNDDSNGLFHTSGVETSRSLPKKDSHSDRNTQSRSSNRAEKDEKTAALELEVNTLKESMNQMQTMIESQFSDMKESFFKTMITNELHQEKKVVPDAEMKKNNIRWAEKYLYERDFSPMLIKDLVDYLNTQKTEIILEKNRILISINEFLKRNLVNQEISIENYNHGNYILLAGPTGVGKTITTVKMAAHLAVMRQKSMRFISIDRYKVGADSQLKTYAELMNAPFYPIHTEKDFFGLMEKKETDFTFIDTAGKGPREGVHIKDLSDWIKRAGKNIDIHLVISCGTKGSDLDFYMDKYAPLGFDHILATKQDETLNVGSVLSLVYQSKKPLSFITNGQEVPQDIEIANIDKLIADSLK